MVPQIASSRIVDQRIALLLGVALVTCRDLTAPSAQAAFDPPDARPYVVGEARANLDATGRFRLPDLPALGVESGISRVTARALAVAALESFVTTPPLPGLLSVADELEAIHGRSIDWARVIPGPRVFPLMSQLAPLPDSLPILVRRSFGSHYAVPFFVDGVQVAALSVSALATNVLIEDGRIRRDPTEMGGGEFTWEGVPAPWGHGIPLAPEEAVRYVYLRTGVKVRAVPLLARFASDFGPLTHRWIIRLERPVAFTLLHDGSVVTTDTIHVAPLNIGVDRDVGGPRLALRMFVAAPEQPDSEQLQVPEFDTDGNVVGISTYLAQIGSSTPITLMEVLPFPR